MTTPQEDRIFRAGVAYKAYRDTIGTWGDDEEVMSDLLADLMHYVDSLRVDRDIEQVVTFQHLLDRAEMNYQAEKLDIPTQPPIKE